MSKELIFEPITPEQIREYANASGDHNPIHLNQETAQAQGLSDIIAHGMLLLGLANRALSDWGFDTKRIRKLKSRFKDKVLCGERLKAKLLEKKTNEQGDPEIHWSLYRVEDASEVLSAQVSFRR